MRKEHFGVDAPALEDVVHVGPFAGGFLRTTLQALLAAELRFDPVFRYVSSFRVVEIKGRGRIPSIRSWVLDDHKVGRKKCPRQKRREHQP